MMIGSLKITRRNIVRIILLAIFPWLPAYLFEKIDFYFGISGNSYWYYQLSGTRLEADVVSFALGGILVAYLLRPRWAMIQRSEERRVGKECRSRISMIV